MRKILLVFFFFSIFSLNCQRKEESFYRIGVFQVNDAPTLNVVYQGFVSALEENGLFDDKNIRLIRKNGMGDIPRLQKIAQEFVDAKVDMIVALSTPCLQAALHATREIPIIFSSVANPYLAGAGKSAEDHLVNVSGVSSRGPIRQSLAFMKEILPDAKRIGTLWTPSEVNSEYYLELARKSAGDLGLEIVAVPINNASEVLLSAQLLINKKIDVIYQISDNTINASFEAMGTVAADNGIPLFGGFLLSAQMGSCAAMGWDFFEMGYNAGHIALRVKKGDSLSDIPIQNMYNVQLHINLNAAEQQGIEFSEAILERADEILGSKESYQSFSSSS
ncbi:ABC transporter substrate-binding protein [Acidobacteriota bacterium]